jgi:parallel beta helix pectate lyase-like protein
MMEFPRTMITATAIAAIAVACRGSTHSPPAGSLQSNETAGSAPVPAPDTIDDRPELEAAIRKAMATGGDLVLPVRTYTLSPLPRAFYCLEVPGGLRIHGAGQGKTVLKMAGDAGRSVRLLKVTGDDVLIEDLTLDGNKTAQSRDKQRHGIFAGPANRLQVRRVTAQNFTGDGFYLYNEVKDAVFDTVLATANDRNGLTLGANIDGTTITHSRFTDNRIQQVDSEPGGTAVVSNTTVTDCVLDSGASNDYALTVSGTPKAQGSGWRVHHNTINGGIFVVWAEHVVIEDNTGVNATTKPAVTVYRSSADVTIRHNQFKLTRPGVRSLAGILVQGTGPGATPARVVVAGNDIEITHEQSFGVRAEGAIDVTIVDNILRGAGRAAPGYAGIALRATIPTEDFRSAVVRGNTVRNFGDRGITIAGNGQAKLRSLEIRDNTFDNDRGAPAMTTAISLDDNNGAAENVVVSGNHCLHGVTAQVINVPPHARVTSDVQPPATP